MAAIPKPIPHLGLYPYSLAAEAIANANGLDDNSETALRHEMAAAILAGELQSRVEATGGPSDIPSSYVCVKDTNTWLSANEYPYLWIEDGSSGTNKNNIFQKMENLSPEEITITFVGVKSDTGMGNNMAVISARGIKKRVPLAALSFVDGRKGGVLDSQGTLLLAMTKKNKSLPSANKNSQQMTRLRKKLKTYFGISSDPFYPYNPSCGWEPRFKIEDKIGAPDERAKVEGERKNVSWDEIIEAGEKIGIEDEYPFVDEEDEADKFLKNTDN
jgi:hypothetical protein